MTKSDSSHDTNHVAFMGRALELARLAAANGDVPVGAVVVRNGQIIGEGYNRLIADNDPTAHAEVVAIRQAASSLQNYRLVDCDLYVTLEPCSMCVGAITHARLRHLYFSATEPKAGAVVSGIELLNASHFNHRLTWDAGMLESESSTMLSDFFAARRIQHKENKKTLTE